MYCVWGTILAPCKHDSSYFNLTATLRTDTFIFPFYRWQNWGWKLNISSRSHNEEIAVAQVMKPRSTGLWSTKEHLNMLIILWQCSLLILNDICQSLYLHGWCIKADFSHCWFLTHNGSKLTEVFFFWKLNRNIRVHQSIKLLLQLYIIVY